MQFVFRTWRCMDLCLPDGWYGVVWDTKEHDASRQTLHDKLTPCVLFIFLSTRIQWSLYMRAWNNTQKRRFVWRIGHLRMKLQLFYVWQIIWRIELILKCYKVWPHLRRLQYESGQKARHIEWLFLADKWLLDELDSWWQPCCTRYLLRMEIGNNETWIIDS